MNPAPSDRLVTTELADGVRYVLPRPPVGQRIGGGIVLFIFGSVFGGFAAFWIYGAAGGLSGGQSAPGVMGIIFPLFGLPFLFIGLGIMLAGLAAMFGQGEIEISRGRVCSVLRMGALRFRMRRVAEDQIKQLVVRKRPPSQSQNGAARSSSYRLIAKLSSGTERVFCFAEKPVLVALAGEIARRLSLEAPDQLDGQDNVDVEIDDEEPDDLDIDDEATEYDERLSAALGSTSINAPKPIKSKAVLTNNPDGLTIDLPPGGWRATKGLLSFAIIWNVFVGVILGVVLTIKATKPSSSAPPTVLVVIVSVFFLIGILMLIASINMARKRAVIDVVNGAVLVTQKGMFRVKQRQWDAGAIQRVEVGPSGTTVNNRPILELHIFDQADKKTGMLMGRDEDELDWIAAELRKSLGIAGKNPRGRRRRNAEPDDDADD